MAQLTTEYVARPRGKDTGTEQGEAVFGAILSEDPDWKPFAAFPPSARLAVLEGHPMLVPNLRVDEVSDCR